MKMVSFETVGKVSLTLGLVLLLFSSFDGLHINFMIPVLLLILGIVSIKSEESSNQEIKKSFKTLSLFLIMIGNLMFGLLYSSYLILQGLNSVQYEKIYYFTSQIMSQLRSGSLGFPNLGFLLGLLFSSTLVLILIIDWMLLSESEVKPKSV